MTRHRLRTCLAVLGFTLALPPLRAEPPPGKAAPDREVRQLAERIDQLVAERWEAKKTTPAPQADDAEFLRRIYLDLAGRIPRFSEVRDFLDDKSPDKRQREVEKLLKGPHYVNHFTAVWRTLLVPPNNNQQPRFLANQLDPWLRKRLRDNAPYDQMVRDLLTASVAFNRMAPPGPNNPSPLAFYQANELKAENLAASTSRLFLGVKLECAQCHDHPFGKWSRKQFWEYAAFFSGLAPLQPQAGAFSPAKDAADRHEIKIPGTEKTVQARFLDGKEPQWKSETPARNTLADWMTADDNPFLARAAVNRLWGHFFGIGLVDPVDDFNDDNPPSHAELLDELARAFVRNRYDQKFLIRAITSSRAYQLTSTVTDSRQNDPRLFARMALKGMTAEQLFDSLALATGWKEQQLGQPNRNPFGSAREEFLAKFANHSDKRTEHHTSILQALSLMNGKLVSDLTSLDEDNSVYLVGLLDAPYMDDRQRLETIFMLTLSRPMRPEEEKRLVKYVKDGGPSSDSRKALADVFWVLINSSEFSLNH
jgi:hypothetical protein